MSNTLDFEQFDAEAKHRPLVVKNLLGRDWNLPGIGQLPARVVMWQSKTAGRLFREAKARKIDLSDPNAQIPDDLLEALLDATEDSGVVAGIVGEENLAEMHRLGITERQLNRLVSWAQEQHMAARARDEEPEEEADHPTSRSSSEGTIS